MSYDLYRLYINMTKKMRTKAVMAIFVKNMFSPVDFFVLVIYLN